MPQPTPHPTGAAVLTARRPTSRTPGDGVTIWTFVLAATALAPLRAAGVVLAALLAVLVRAAAVGVPARATAAPRT